MCFPVLCPDSLVTLLTWRWRESTAVDSERRDSGDGDVLYIAWVARATLDMRTKNSYSRMAVNRYYTVSLLFKTGYQNLHWLRCGCAHWTHHKLPDAKDHQHPSLPGTTPSKIQIRLKPTRTTPTRSPYLREHYKDSQPFPTWWKPRPVHRHLVLPEYLSYASCFNLTAARLHAMAISQGSGLQVFWWTSPYLSINDHLGSPRA